MTSSATYFDGNFLKELENSKEIKSKIDTLVKFAERGEVQAATIYGLSLISGIWDEERMMDDLVRGQRIPVPKDPNDLDPYLVLPRDVFKGVNFLMKAADSKHLQEDKSVKRAQNILSYLQCRGLAGFTRVHKDSDEISRSDAQFLNKNAGSSIKKGFTQLPDVRPKVVNMRNEPFLYYAETIRDRFMIQCIIGAVLINLTLLVMQILYLDPKPWLVYIKVNVFNLVFHIIPLGILAFLANKLGIKQKLALCNCKKIREAYSAAQSKLPQEFRDKSSIFETTPLFVQYLIPLKQVIFWIESFILIFIICIMFEDFKNVITPKSGYFSGIGPFTILAELIVMYSMTFAIIVWDKRLPDFIMNALENSHGVGIFAFIAMAIFMNLISIGFDHRDCCNAIERIEQKSTFYKILESKE